jgi:hypothetical protein
MDFVGIGVAVIFGFLAFAVKNMPPAIAWGGVALGIVILVWKHIPVNAKFNGPLALIAVAFILGVAAAAWAISVSSQLDIPQMVASEKPEHQSRAVFKVDKGANVEDAKITNSKLRGFDKFADVAGNMKGLTIDNTEIDASGTGPSRINADSGYFGPPRTWVIPEKLWTFSLPPTPNSDGTFTAIECVALRGGFFPKTVVMEITGNGIRSASVTRYQDAKVLDERPYDGKSVSLKVSPPEAHYTYGIRILLTDKDAKPKIAYRFP